MTTRKKIVASLLLLAVLGGVTCRIFRSRIPDPIYGGKPLSYLLEQHDQVGPSGWEGWHAGVREVGTNAIPLLLRLMRAHDPPIKRKLMALAVRLHLIKVPFLDDAERHKRAYEGFTVLRADGAGAVPELKRIYDLNLSIESKTYVLMSLGHIGTGAKEAIPLMLRAATNGDPNVSGSAVFALGQMRVQPETIVPVLINRLNDSSDLGGQLVAVRGLANFGPQAKAAVPLLFDLRYTLQLTNGSSTGRPVPREWIDEALKKIDPAAAANAGIK